MGSDFSVLDYAAVILIGQHGMYQQAAGLFLKSKYIRDVCNTSRADLVGYRAIFLDKIKIIIIMRCRPIIVGRER